MYWPQTVHSLGMTEAQRGWTVSFILIPTMAGSLLAGRNKFITRDRSGLIKILLIIGVGLLISSCASNLIVFLIGLVVIELPYGGLRIVLYGHLYEEIHPNHRSTVNSMVSAVQTAGGAVSLLIMGRVADLYSPQIAMGLGGSIIIMVLTTILLIRLVRQ
ncbi:Major facilitator superfamily MFS-1 [sediment metagenome]|uniref:Major facilitator superfamily MFS-1 n=1 Tax=sediment metagenome TaxID=749907 RepID=D9PJS5_9ZZZZ